MDGPTGIPDPDGLTQPIPAVRTVPPLRTPAQASPQPTTAGVAAQPAAQPYGAVPAGGAVPYVHRFGSIPLYLFARLAAFVIDVFVVGFMLATFGYHATDLGAFVVAGHDPNGYATLVELALGIALLFAFVCESLFGTTLGKLLFALHVRRRDGRHAGAARVFVRYLLRPIDVLVVGPLLALVTPRHQRIGDFAAGTVVSRSRIGPFAPVLGLVALAVAGYAQIVYGGGLTSAIGVSAETADYAPGLIGRATAIFGVPSVRPAVAPQTQASAAPATATPMSPPSGGVQ